VKAQDRIGRYILLSRLGTGSAGEVWAALLEGPVGFRKRVALKLVAATARDALALRREARLGALLRHPNLVDVYELGRADDGRVFLAMELVPGPSLGELLKRHGALEGPTLRDVGMQLARGLGYVHRLPLDEKGERIGLVHRDVKPTNVLLDPAGVVKLADLGIARLTGERAKSIEGTPGYLAPEQLDGAPPAPPADVFSAGMVLWAMAVGKSPLRGGKGMAQALRAAVTAQSKALRARAILAEALPGLDEIVLTCLDPDPAGRFADGKELRDALRGLREPAGEGLYECLARYEAQDEPASHAPRGVTVSEGTSSSRTSGLRPEERSFHGRVLERTAVEKAVGELPGVVTLKGMAGIGKTRLANHVAHRYLSGLVGTVTPGQERPVLWADLAAAGSAAGLVQAVAVALRVSLDVSEPERVLERALAECGAALLVLDRVDDVRPAVVSRLAVWRREAPQLRVLCTSRQALKVPGEVVVELGPLTSADAMTLFRERAVRPVPATADDDVLELVQRLDHHPLAIELVAARTNLLEVDELVARLDRLSLGDDALELAIQESWTELPPWSRHALVQLSAFRGTFPVQAAEAVVEVSRWDDAPWPLDLIDDLWQRSMLYVRHTRRGPRLGMAAAMRAFAARHAGDNADPAEVLRGAMQRHGDWYARTGDATRLDALRGSDGAKRLRELASDVEDLIVALERAVARGDTAVAEAVGLAAAEVLVRRGPFPRAEKVIRTVLALDGLERRDHALLLLAQVAKDDDPEVRAGWWSEALAASPTPRRRARVLALQARQLATVSQQAARALMLVDESWDEVLASGDAFAQVSLGIAKGVAQRVLGDSEGACVSLTDAITKAERLGAPEEEGSGNLSLGNLLYNLGQYDQAFACYDRAEKRFRKLGYKSSVATALANKALVHNAWGDAEATLASASAAESIARSIGDTHSVLAAMATRPPALERLGKHEEALHTLEAVCNVARKLKAWRSLSINLCNVAHTLAIVGRGEEGLGPLMEAVEVSQRIGNPRSEALARGNLGILHLDAGRLAEARRELDRAVELSIGIDPRFEGGFRSARARCNVLAGDDPSDDLRLAKQLLVKVLENTELAKLGAVEAMWLGRQGDLKGALARLDDLREGDDLLARRVEEARAFLRRL